MTDTKFTDIAARVEASMCLTFGAQHPDGREEARISKADWEAIMTMVGHRALWLVAQDGNAVLKTERTKGDWVTLITESIDGPFSHIIEPSGIAVALAPVAGLERVG
jgi:hypothetical protein